jgi:predicted dehydrogenase
MPSHPSSQNSRTLRTSRRTWLKQMSAAGAAGLAAPAFISNLRAAPPSEQVRHASFGASGMAHSDWSHIAGHKLVRIHCIAEVDSERLVQLKKFDPEGKVKVYADWREMLDKEAKNLDTVNVSTPDHMHAPQAMSALNAGLHVYGQKPLAHDVYECRRLADVAREKKLVTQMGIQVHSSTQYRMAAVLVQDGAIGKIREVHTWSNKKWGDGSPRPDRKDPVPASLNWDLWLGTAADRPFLGGGYYHPGNWRKRLDFGTGTFGDMGCHIYDPVFKAVALTAPLSVRSTGPTPTEHNWANDAVVKYVFPGNQFTADKTVSVTWYDGDAKPPAEITSQLGKLQAPGQGSIFLGTDGVMVLPHVGNPILLPESKYADTKLPQLPPVDHWFQFIDAARGEGKTSAGFDYSGPLTESILLGGVASRFPEQTLEWDAAALKFKNNPEADKLLRREYRKGWEVPGLS